jgi:tetratricopeptide (TPR) repeat protein
MEDKHFQHALVLLQQSRHDLAEPELRKAIAADPDNALAHAFLARCLLERNELEDATQAAKTAIRLAPETPFAHATLALVLANRRYFNDALKSIQEALRLNPADAANYALLASIHIERREWSAALSAAEQGLEHDAEHVGCNNARAMVLTKLGRTAEAGTTLAATLNREPENAFSHANLGWTALYERNNKKALQHFSEALRLDPTLDYAKAGLVEGLKARNPIYGLMLRYFLFMGRLTSRAQWGIIVGAYLGYRFLGGLADDNPQWRPWLQPLLIAYFVFAIMTWLAAPFFNLLLRLNRYGRYALSADQRRSANLVGILALPALACLIWWLASDNGLALLGALYFGLLLLPASAIFNCDAGWPRRCMAVYTLVLASLLPLSIPLGLLNRQWPILCLQGHVWGCFLSGLVANGLIMVRAKR